ncbi:MAG TPA: hypothetical protein VK140_06280 [Ktedonobacteraceae bacterium]|nr:hypothetical protein [Ktedonobacteraceae bacterium]
MPFFEIDFIALLTTIFWVWMMLDCILQKRVKLFWLLLIFFTHMVGAVIYYFVACGHKNPVDALSYYVSYLKNAFKQKNPARPFQPIQPTFTPPVYQPARPAPTPQAYPSYEQGYSTQHYEPAPVPVAQQEESPFYHPQPQYEEQLTITYPEMPPQQMPPQQQK